MFRNFNFSAPRAALSSLVPSALPVLSASQVLKAGKLGHTLRDAKRPSWLAPVLDTAKGVLMCVGIVALIAWQVQAFSYAPNATPPAAPTQPRLEAQPILDAIAPVKIAEAHAAVVQQTTPVKAAGTTTTVAEIKNAAALGTPQEQKRVAQHIARKFRVAAEAIELLVGAAYLAGREHEVDPMLILGVMAVESRFNPFAESVMGAQGLMQIIPKFHMDKFEEHGGKAAILNPVANINVGAEILKEYMARAGGLEAGLKRYSGATGDSDNGYAAKVLAERNELLAVKGGKKIVSMPVVAKPKPAPEAPVLLNDI